MIQQSAIINSSALPFTVMPLTGWDIVTVEGQDAATFLQGQITADISTLKENTHIIAAHCNTQGKVLSNFILFKTPQGFCYIQRKNISEKQQAEFKKYAVFSKVTIASSPKLIALGFAGKHAKEHLNKLFTILPDSNTRLISTSTVSLLHFSLPDERFVIVCTEESAKEIMLAFNGEVILSSSNQWVALDIEAGYPLLDTLTTQCFLPQSLNLHAINAISFQKGCYVGQEIVARAKYRGINKRALFWLSGKAGRQPNVGEQLEKQLGDHWRETGTVLQAVTLHDGLLWVQAVLNNDSDGATKLRIKNDAHHILTINSLPYSLT